MYQSKQRFFIILLLALSTFFVSTSTAEALDKEAVKFLTETFSFSSIEVKMKNMDIVPPQKISQKLIFKENILEVNKTINDNRYTYIIKLENINPKPRSFTYNDNFAPKWYLLKYWVANRGVDETINKNGKETRKQRGELQLDYYGKFLDTSKVLLAFSKLIDQSKSK